MPDVLILIGCLALLALALGLPLLSKAGSLLSEVIALGTLTGAVVAFAWITGAYWIMLPILALVAFVAWLETAKARTHDRTHLRLRLWRTANRVQIALGACVVILLAAGFTRSLELIAPWIVIVAVAMAAFRFSFFCSSRSTGSRPAG